jgi:endonuclease YncB( thermonuclease family)
MLRFAILAALSLSIVGPACAAEPGPSGSLRVVDADTFDVGGIRVRLHGIDAPEQGQLCGAPGGGDWACGAWATGEARRRYEGRSAACVAIDIDPYGRVVARCTVDGVDMGAAMVGDGIAFAYRRYATTYVAAETAASLAGLGVWAGDAIAPEQARRQAGASAPAPVGCAIKGNVSGNGRIYHLPGQEFYDRTRIRTARGERWFCSEAEARDAGWRRAQR